MGKKRYGPKSERRKNVGIGAALTKMRLKTGYSPGQVQELTGYTHQSLSLLESDSPKGNPPLLTLAMLAECYDCEVRDFFLPTKSHKKYPNKEHEKLHSKVQEYIERGYRELKNMRVILGAILDDESLDGNQE